MNRADACLVAQSAEDAATMQQAVADAGRLPRLARGDTWAMAHSARRRDRTAGLPKILLVRTLKTTALLAATLTLVGCEGTAGGGSTYADQNGYAAPGYYSSPGYYNSPGYYGSPTYVAPSYGVQPGYAVPYGYQPGYVTPYAYGPGGRDRDHWREHESHEYRERDFQNGGGRPYSQQPPAGGQIPHVGFQPNNPMPAAPPPAQPPPAARPQVQQNQKLLDQLGFRPSR